MAGGSRNAWTPCGGCRVGPFGAGRWLEGEIREIASVVTVAPNRGILMMMIIWAPLPSGSGASSVHSFLGTGPLQDCDGRRMSSPSRIVDAADYAGPPSSSSSSMQRAEKKPASSRCWSFPDVMTERVWLFGFCVALALWLVSLGLSSLSSFFPPWSPLDPLFHSGSHPQPHVRSGGVLSQSSSPAARRNLACLRSAAPGGVWRSLVSLRVAARLWFAGGQQLQ